MAGSLEALVRKACETFEEACTHTEYAFIHVERRTV
jgi:hypothetical protein